MIVTKTTQEENQTRWINERHFYAFHLLFIKPPPKPTDVISEVICRVFWKTWVRILIIYVKKYHQSDFHAYNTLPNAFHPHTLSGTGYAL